MPNFKVKDQGVQIYGGSNVGFIHWLWMDLNTCCATALHVIMVLISTLTYLLWGAGIQQPHKSYWPYGPTPKCQVETERETHLNATRRQANEKWWHQRAPMTAQFFFLFIVSCYFWSLTLSNFFDFKMIRWFKQDFLGRIVRIFTLSVGKLRIVQNRDGSLIVFACS